MTIRRSPAIVVKRFASASPTPRGLASFSRNRFRASSVSCKYRSSASNPLAAHTDGSPCLARSASRALTGNTSASTPSRSRAALWTKATTSWSCAASLKISILFRTMTIFLPQSRIAARNTRSVSVNGRSADVTNSTRSDRGTKSVVMRSCSRMIALVPGVSTTWTSRSSSTGAVRIRRPLASVSDVTASPYFSSWICAVVGVTPSSTTDRPSKALMNALFPALNSPTMTMRNSSSSWRMEDGQRGAIFRRGAEFGERIAQCRQQLARLRKLSLGGRFKDSQHA